MGSRALIDTLRANLENTTRRIAAAALRAGRDPGDVRLVAVTKSVSTDIARRLHALGQIDLAENRVQPALARIEAIGTGPVWHLVGHLQSNKVRKAVGQFAWIHSVDSLALLERIQRVVEENRAPPPGLFLEVNVTGEASKYGITPEKVQSVLAAAARFPSVNILGLMTMARYDPDPETARPAFRALAELRDDANRGSWYHDPLPHLSMGMTDDFEVAVEEGATWVRVGRALFESRDGG